MALHIVLIEPEIPQNTGNIARTCAALGASLHLVEPLGFSIDSKYVKRAGLDYWDLLDIHTYPSLDAFLEIHDSKKLYLFSTKAQCIYSEASFPEECYLVFGKETKGLPETLLLAHPSTTLRIPMISEARSLNLSNSVAIAAYEYMRQYSFRGLLATGSLHEHSWDEISPSIFQTATVKE